MSDIKLSSYISAFDLIKNTFPYEKAVSRFISFFDETVIAVNTSSDDTLARLREIEVASGGKLKVIETSFSYNDIEFDGKIKNAALQACTVGDVLIQMDMDEYIPLSLRPRYEYYAEELLKTPDIDALLIPSLDLWGDSLHIRALVPIGQKYRIHKKGLHRGVRPDAWKPDGKINTSLSDTCELLREDNTLARAASVATPDVLNPFNCWFLQYSAYSVHEGYLDFDQRIRVNNAIWASHWPLRSGHAEDVATDKAALEKVETLRHNLPLEQPSS